MYWVERNSLARSGNSAEPYQRSVGLKDRLIWLIFLSAGTYCPLWDISGQRIGGDAAKPRQSSHSIHYLDCCLDAGMWYTHLGRLFSVEISRRHSTATSTWWRTTWLPAQAAKCSSNFGTAMSQENLCRTIMEWWEIRERMVQIIPLSISSIMGRSISHVILSLGWMTTWFLLRMHWNITRWKSCYWNMKHFGLIDVATVLVCCRRSLFLLKMLWSTPGFPLLLFLVLLQSTGWCGWPSRGLVDFFFLWLSDTAQDCLKPVEIIPIPVTHLIASTECRSVSFLSMVLSQELLLRILSGTTWSLSRSHAPFIGGWNDGQIHKPILSFCVIGMPFWCLLEAGHRDSQVPIPLSLGCARSHSFRVCQVLHRHHPELATCMPFAGKGHIDFTYGLDREIAHQIFSHSGPPGARIVSSPKQMPGKRAWVFFFVSGVFHIKNVRVDDLL